MRELRSDKKKNKKIEITQQFIEGIGSTYYPIYKFMHFNENLNTVYKS